jgi:hypothetical protein
LEPDHVRTDVVLGNVPVRVVGVGANVHARRCAVDHVGVDVIRVCVIPHLNPSASRHRVDPVSIELTVVRSVDVDAVFLNRTKPNIVDSVVPYHHPGDGVAPSNTEPVSAMGQWD